MKTRLILIAFLALFPLSLIAQKQTLKDDYFLQNIEDCVSKTRLKETLWDLKLISPDSLKVSISNSNKDIHSVQAFKIEGDSLILGYQKFGILKHSVDSLILTQNSDSICKKFYFVSRGKLIKQQETHFFIHENDTIYFANHFNGPVVNNKKRLDKYFSHEFPIKGFGPKPCKVKLQFIITKTGEIKSPRGNFECKNTHPKRAVEFIKKTEGLWEPMTLNGKPVNALVRIRFTHNPPKEQPQLRFMIIEEREVNRVPVRQ